MEISKYREILKYLKSLIEDTDFKGHVYAVGGCERDAYFGNPIKDIDLVVDIPDGGIKFAKWLQENSLTNGSVVTYPNFGTAMFKLKKYPDDEIEVVHTRKECYRDDQSRNPETSFGIIQEDCMRRDFTYNAIYYNITEESVFYFNPKTQADIKANILRACGEPNIIFNEDPLRILRAIRFACRYNSVISEDTYVEMIVNCKRLEIISKERIQEEVVKMLTCDNVSLALYYLNRIGAMQYVFPNVSAQYSTVYSTEANVLRSINLSKSKDLIVNLCIILDNSTNAKEDLQYLKFSNNIIDACLDILDVNINDILIEKEPLTDEKLREFQYKCGKYENFVRRLDYIRSVYYRYNIDKIVMDAFERTNNMVMKGTAMFGYKLPISGLDVMRVKNIEPSAKVKVYLEKIMRYAFKNPEITENECITLLKYTI